MYVTCCDTYLKCAWLLQVVARDEESGEEVSASVDVEVLQRGQTGDNPTNRKFCTHTSCGGTVGCKLKGCIL